jgi:hypothetical protein
VLARLDLPPVRARACWEVVFVHITRTDRRRLRAYLAAVQANEAPGGSAVLSSPPSAVAE